MNKEGLLKIDWGNYALGLLAKVSEVVKLTSRQQPSPMQPPSFTRLLIEVLDRSGLLEHNIVCNISVKLYFYGFLALLPINFVVIHFFLLFKSFLLMNLKVFLS